MQGIGQMIGEHCIYDRDSGQFLTGTFMDYYMPRAGMLPDLAARPPDRRRRPIRSAPRAPARPAPPARFRPSPTR